MRTRTARYALAVGLVAGLVALSGGPILAQTEPGLDDAPREPPRQARVRDSRSDEEQTRRGRAEADEEEIVRRRDGTPEFIAVGPAAEAAAVAEALQEAGAVLVRRRAYPALGQAAQVFTLPRGLSVAEARALLAEPAPGTRFDAHHLYAYAQGAPRLYAAALVMPGAQARCRAARTGVIGMIDGPVDAGHPVLRGARLRVESVLGPRDRVPDADHGTAVAALMVGEDPGGALAGFAAGARLHAVAAFAETRRGARGDVERIGAALDRLTGQGVRLINLSFAGPENGALAAVLDAAAGRGVVMVGASGNDAAEAGWPAAAPSVIAVTAVDAALRPYSRANRGPEIEFAAPGVDLWAAQGGGGGYVSGTSYAAPIVTAIAARMGAGSGLSAEGLRSGLRASARDIAAPGRDGATGWGLVRGPGC